MIMIQEINVNGTIHFIGALPKKLVLKFEDSNPFYPISSFNTDLIYNEAFQVADLPNVSHAKIVVEFKYCDPWK